MRCTRTFSDDMIYLLYTKMYFEMSLQFNKRKEKEYKRMTLNTDEQVQNNIFGASTHLKNQSTMWVFIHLKLPKH